MKIKDYRCKCGNNEFFFIKKNELENTVGIYCDKCGKWLKWADKEEKRLWASKQLENYNQWKLKSIFDNSPEIKVGNEIAYGTHIGVCTKFYTEDDKDFMYIMWKDGSCGGLLWNMSDFTKTGRDFPQIREVLKMMKGEADGNGFA